MFVEIALSPFENSDIDVYTDKKLCELEHTDDVVPISEYLSNLKNFLDRLNDNVGIFVVFWTFEMLNAVGRLNSFKSEACSCNGRIGWGGYLTWWSFIEVCPCIQKIRFAFNNWRHRCCRHGGHSITKNKA